MLHLWLTLMSAFHRLGWRRGYLFALDRASDATDWGPPLTGNDRDPWEGV